MENKQLSLPSQRNYEYAYTLAYKLAAEKLAETQDIERQCRRSGAQYLEIDSQRFIILQFLGRSYQVTLPDIDITPVDSQEAVSLKTKVLILHYLTRAKGTPLASKMITFKELPEGAIYFPTFTKRTIRPLVDYLGEEPHQLIDTAKKLGGRKVDYGDVAVTISAFYYVPITLVLWRGDEEFAPSGSILFDATVADYLSTEDITVLCETIVWKLVRILKQG